MGVLQGSAKEEAEGTASRDAPLLASIIARGSMRSSECASAEVLGERLPVSGQPFPWRFQVLLPGEGLPRCYLSSIIAHSERRGQAPVYHDRD